MEGSEEYFDESEHVDGLAEEERSKTARMGLVRRWMRREREGENEKERDRRRA